MAARALDGYSCYDCNNVTRLVVLPYAGDGHDKPYRVRDAKMNTHLVVCDVRHNHKCKPPDIAELADTQSKSGFVFNSECQTLACVLGRGVDLRCQDLLAKNVSCSACLWHVASHIAEKGYGMSARDWFLVW